MPSATPGCPVCMTAYEGEASDLVGHGPEVPEAAVVEESLADCFGRVTGDEGIA